MKIFIPTKGRRDNQITAAQLSAAGVRFTFACTLGDEPFPDGDVEVFDSEGIADKRQQIIDSHNGKMVMIDDDIKFLSRIHADSGRTRACTPAHLKTMFEETERLLDHYALVGLAERFMLNTRPYPFMSGCRQLHFWAFDTSFVWAHGIRIDRLPLAEDLDFIMQIMRAGGKQYLRTDYVHQDGKQFAPGGCKEERTDEANNAAMERLQELWPDIVSLRMRKGIWRPYISWKKVVNP